MLEMKIVEALKLQNIRISAGTRWLVWGDDAWEVYSRGYNKRSPKLIVITENEEKAVRYLLAEFGE